MGGFKHKMQMGWSGKKRRSKKRSMRKGSILAFVAIAVLILTLLGLGLLSVAYGTRLRAVMFQKKTIAKMAAEAGYENAIHWMNNQPDVLDAMIPGLPKKNRGRASTRTRKVVTERGTGSLPKGTFSYTIDFDHFMGHLPVFRIVSKGKYEQNEHAVEARVIQSIFGLDIGRCEVPDGPFISNFENMFFEDNDVLDMPIHISGNGSKAFDRSADIYIRGKPHFKQKVSVSESRYMTHGRGSDKYKRHLSLFDSGLYFCQPQSNIVKFDTKRRGNLAIKTKTERFSGTIVGSRFNYSRTGGRRAPSPSGVVTNPKKGAVQIKFFIDGNTGKMELTNNITVACKNGGKYDYMIDDPESIRNAHKGYNIYGYHYVNTPPEPESYKITDSYVSNEIKTLLSPAPIKSDKGGQIFVDGDVIIGGETIDDGRGTQIMIAGKRYDPKFKGKLTIVATGNIWIVNSIVYDGPMEKTPEGFDVPAANNPNILGLFARDGVVKIVDPAQSASEPTDYTANGLKYSPIGFKNMGSKKDRPGRGGRSIPEYMRRLANPMVVHAAITAGGGAWGVENVAGRQDTVNIDPRNPPNMLDDLVVAGSITEVLGDMTNKGITGYKKHYYFDKRLLGGILPGDLWLQSKFTPKPGGWSDYRL